MNELELKKKQLKDILNGNKKPKSIEEAKKRLKQTDPGIDIGEILRILNSPSDKRLKLILIELLSSPEIISYFSPFIKEVIIKLLIRS